MNNPIFGTLLPERLAVLIDSILGRSLFPPSKSTVLNLPQAKPLTCSLGLYSPLDCREPANLLKAHLAEHFGGCSVLPAEGWWQSSNGIIQEPIELILGYGTHTDVLAVLPSFIAHVLDIGMVTGQEAMLIEVGYHGKIQRILLPINH